jgi:hypothetical protein
MKQTLVLLALAVVLMIPVDFVLAQEAVETKLKEASPWIFMLPEYSMLEDGREFKMYFQTWISIAALVLALIMAFLTFLTYRKTAFKPFKWVPVSFLFFALSFVPVGYHLSRCHECAGLGLCGLYHNYGNLAGLIGMIVVLCVAMWGSAAIFEPKLKIIFKKVMFPGLIIAAIAMLAIMLIGTQMMAIPEKMSYPPSVFNPEVVIFVGIILISLFFFVKLLNLYLKSEAKLILPVAIGFLVVALSQIPAAYHILTCYWCHVMDCSEWYTLGGLSLFIAELIFYRSFSPFIDMVKEAVESTEA